MSSPVPSKGDADAAVEPQSPTRVERRNGGASEEDEEDAGPSSSRRTAAEEEDGQEQNREQDEGDDDLFGGGSDEGEEEEEEDAIKRPNRQRRRVDSQSPARSSEPVAEQSKLTISRTASPASNRSEDRNDDLELRETSAEPPMGYREGEEQETELQEAAFTLPSIPVRRGAPHFFARLPNLLQYRADVFDEQSFDEKLEDDQLQSREGIRIDDEGLRSLLTTSNTIRWRWSNKRDAGGVRVPESNARIVRWSDGSSSLQLGSEFYDISTTTERVQAPSHSQSQTQTQTSGSIVPPQPPQHLTHLFVKHDGQEQVNMFQAEAPIVGSLTFRPTSITSESHQRLAKAVRQQRGTLVKETVTREDPEMEKERLEREERKRKQIRAREQRKRAKGREDDEDDAFWASAGRAVRRMGGAGRREGVAMAGALDDDADQDIEGTGALDAAADDDGFVVEDDDDDGGDENGAREREMEVDEPDEMDRMEAEMERQEARRLASKAGGAGTDANGIDGGETADGTSAGRRRRIIESDDEE